VTKARRLLVRGDQYARFQSPPPALIEGRIRPRVERQLWAFDLATGTCCVCTEHVCSGSDLRLYEIATRPTMGLSDCAMVTASSRPQDIELMGTTVLTHGGCATRSLLFRYIIGPVPPAYGTRQAAAVR